MTPDGKVVISFDVDGTLITFEDEPREDVIQFLKLCSNLGMYIVIWSGGGKDYCEMWVRRLYLGGYIDEIRDKPYNVKEIADAKEFVDISLDDEIVVLAKVNIKL